MRKFIAASALALLSACSPGGFEGPPATPGGTPVQVGSLTDFLKTHDGRCYLYRLAGGAWGAYNGGMSASATDAASSTLTFLQNHCTGAIGQTAPVGALPPVAPTVAPK